MRKRGFLLIECCVYIALCAILMATLMRWIAQTMLESGQHTVMVQKSVTNALVHDVLMRDIQSAPCNEQAWHIESNAMVWKVNDTTSIGWYKEKGRLVRKEGRYDSRGNRWGKHNPSTIACNVQIFKSDAHKNQRDIQGIEITLGIDDSEPSTRYIRLRNGRAYEKRA